MNLGLFESRPRFVVVSFYTKDTDYEQEARKLIETLEQFGVKHDVQPVENRKDWVLNTQQKPAFIKAMLQKHGCPVVWLDADARLAAYPELFHGLGDVDFAAHFRDGKELLSGTMFINNTPTAFGMLDDWISCNTKNPKVPDQKTLANVIFKIANIRIAVLPASYCKIFDLMKSVPNQVVLHTQASRRLKVAVSTSTREVVPLLKIEGIKEFVSGKSVIFVGNSEMLMRPPNMGNFIDSFDVVVRFNAGMMDGHRASHLGHRTDIWVINASKRPMDHQMRALRWFYPKVKQAIWISPGHLLAPYQKRTTIDISKAAYQPPYEQYESFCEQNGFYTSPPKNHEKTWKNKIPGWYRALHCPSPSAGVRAVDLFLRYVGTQKSVTLIGFDSFKKRTWYNPGGYITPHSSELESKYLQGLHDSGAIKMIQHPTPK
jgi:hypothetical protein